MDDARPFEPKHEPWPYLGKVEARLREAIAEGKAEVAAELAEPPEPDPEAEAARRRARRREDRLRNIEMVRLATTDTLFRTTEYLAGRLNSWQAGNIDRARDPLAAVPAINRSIIQLTLLEERLDESDEERTQRIKAEAEAKARAAAAAAAERDEKAGEARRSETRRRVHDTVRAISLACLEPSLDYRDRESLLEDVFSDYEDDTGDSYDGDPAQLAADILTRLLDLHAEQMDRPGAVPDILSRRVRLVALAREYLAGLQGPHVLHADGPALAAPALAIPAECAQGPPDSFT
jgi:hypothetical protein